MTEITFTHVLIFIFSILGIVLFLILYTHYIFKPINSDDLQDYFVCDCATLEHNKNAHIVFNVKGKDFIEVCGKCYDDIKAAEIKDQSTAFNHMEHECKFYVNADWSAYTTCICGKQHEQIK